MAEEKLLTIREASVVLGISEKEIIDLAEDGSLPAYKIGGVYLRFKREQIEEYKKNAKNLPHKHAAAQQKYSLPDRISDFFYFNDFYLVCGVIIILILLIIFQG